MAEERVYKHNVVVQPKKLSQIQLKTPEGYILLFLLLEVMNEDNTFVFEGDKIEAARTDKEKFALAYNDLLDADIIIIEETGYKINDLVFKKN